MTVISRPRAGRSTGPVTPETQHHAAIVSCARAWKADRSVVWDAPINEPDFFRHFETSRGHLAHILKGDIAAFLEDAYAAWFTQICVARAADGSFAQAKLIEPAFAILDGNQAEIDRFVRKPNARNADMIVALIPWSFTSDDIAAIPADALYEALLRCHHLPWDTEQVQGPSADDLLILREGITRTMRFSGGRPVLMAGIAISPVDVNTLEAPQSRAQCTLDVGVRETWIEHLIRSSAPTLTVAAYTNPITAVRAFRR